MADLGRTRYSWVQCRKYPPCAIFKKTNRRFVCICQILSAGLLVWILPREKQALPWKLTKATGYNGPSPADFYPRSTPHPCCTPPTPHLGFSLTKDWTMILIIADTSPLPPPGMNCPQLLTHIILLSPKVHTMRFIFSHFIMHCLIWYWLCECRVLLLHVKKKHHMIQSCRV